MTEPDDLYRELKHLIAVRLDESFEAMQVTVTPEQAYRAAEGVMRLLVEAGRLVPPGFHAEGEREYTGPKEARRYRRRDLLAGPWSEWMPEEDDGRQAEAAAFAEYLRAAAKVTYDILTAGIAARGELTP